MTHSRPAIHQLLSDGNLAPRRDLGQNFVADPNTVRRIADLARVGHGDSVIEVGAGLGSLTLALAETGALITAVEIDPGVAAALREVVADLPNVTVLEADAMALDWNELLAGDGTDDQSGAGSGDPGPTRSWTFVANLPYNVGTPLVCDLLDQVPQITRLLVMVQREVAERFAAVPGTSAYGAISVKAAFWGHARVVGLVPAAVFVPRPNVESALLEIERHDPPLADPATMFELVRTAFGQRRKMLRRSLNGVIDPQQFEAAHVSATSRPQELSVDDWCRLAATLPV